MGTMYSSAVTSSGHFSGSAYTNYNNFFRQAERWRNNEEVKKLKVAADGLSVEAEWFDGTWRKATYSPHPGEDTSYKVQPISRIKRKIKG